MAKQIEVELGGQKYLIDALPIAPSKAWREKLAGPFAQISHILTTANTVELQQLGDIAGLVQQFSGVLLGSIDMMLDLMFAYSPKLKEDRQRIENVATDEEALHVFAEVLKLAFPFGVLLEVVTGRTESKTSSNSPSRNGALPLPASGPIKKDRAGVKK